MSEREPEERRARARRDRAARKFKPDRVRLLLIAEAPPAALDRYFYFPKVTEQDSLFRYVARGILKTEPTRTNKQELLGRLRDRGVFLIDLIREPIRDARHDDHVAALSRRIRKIQPDKIILIKASVYDAAFQALSEAGLPVMDERVPFPGSGQQRRFEEAFARALRGRAPTKGAHGSAPTSKGGPPTVPLERRSVRDLLRLYRQILRELRSRGVVRTNNAPTGEWAEHIVRAFTRGELAADPSQKSWDVRTPAGERLQVKSRVVTDPKLRGERQLSPFRSWEFDAAVIVLFDGTYGVWRAARIDVKELQKSARRTEYVRADRVMALDALLDRGDNWTAQLRRTANKL